MELLLSNYSDSDNDVDSKPDEPPPKKAKISNGGVCLDNDEEEEAGNQSWELLLHIFSQLMQIEIVI